MRVLMVTSQLPTAAEPGSMAPLARQIESVRATGAHVEVLEIKGGRGLKYLRALPRLWELARAVDLIHAHYGYCGIVARGQFGKPVVVSFMGDDVLGTPDGEGRVTPLSRLVVYADRWLAHVVDAVIVKSAEMAQVVAPVRAHIVPNGVDFQTFRPMESAAARAELGWTDDKGYVLFAGCPDNPRKGFPLARAAAMSASRRMGQPLELVPLWGVAPDRVPLYMNACRALVMTSLWEGSPNVVKEAMACNLPVVSVPVGDVPELLDGVEGCAVGPRDADALGALLAQVLADGRRSEGRAALERKGLDLESVARRVVGIYEEVLARTWSCALSRP
jgi:glycosyltransferase involved in cell wall biosynthesis